MSRDAHTWCLAFLAASILRTSAKVTFPRRNSHAKATSASTADVTPPAQLVTALKISTIAPCSIPSQDSFAPSADASRPPSLTLRAPLVTLRAPPLATTTARALPFVSLRDTPDLFCSCSALGEASGGDAGTMLLSLTTGVMGSQSRSSSSTNSGIRNSFVPQWPALSSLTSNACAVSSMATYRNTPVYNSAEPRDSDQSPAHSSS
mmetsp:Transcript_18440/g.48660  ORF Transcript_18440/g.48660 Transcript_18440/m.48660 type:complete len:206 (-) Transcript_18440:72-689(-)